MPITRWTPIVAVTLSLAACGGDERLSDRELAAELQPLVERVDRAFGSVFAALGEASEREVVPAAVRERLREAARTERAVAEEAAALRPSESAERDVEALAAGAGAQAADLERLAGDRRLTVVRMADAIEGGAMARVLRRLAARDLVTPPGH